MPGPLCADSPLLFGGGGRLPAGGRGLGPQWLERPPASRRAPPRSRRRGEPPAPPRTRGGAV
eukprot:9475185-Pyramimonas_sp.AAC.1